jgi:hypothetical protein
MYDPRRIATMSSNFINSKQCLALYPRVINIDHKQQETYGTTTTSYQIHSQMDVLTQNRGRKASALRHQNGGPDRRAYPLVPTPHLDHAKKDFHHDLNAIKNFQQHQSVPHSVEGSPSSDHTRPNKIYIPTPAVLHNLHFSITLQPQKSGKAPQRHSALHQIPRQLLHRSSTSLPLEPLPNQHKFLLNPKQQCIIQNHGLTTATSPNK